LTAQRRRLQGMAEGWLSFRLGRPDVYLLASV